MLRYARWIALASPEAAMSANCLLSYQIPVPYSRFPRTLSAAAFVIIVAVVFCVLGLMYFTPLDIVVACIVGIGLLMSILASPVVRVHEWIASWESASTAVICSLIVAGLLTWLGVYYSDREFEEKPVQLGGFARGRLSRIVQRSPYRPEHEPGHQAWCAITNLFYARCSNFMPWHGP
jgi:multisubunit Na+/H+ antiporter MnhB subunit